MAALEALPPPIGEITEATITGISPDTGPVAGGTDVTITGTGLNTFGAYVALLLKTTVGSAPYAMLDNFIVVNDNTITATTAATTDGPGVYSVEMALNGVDGHLVLTDAFTYV